MRLRVYKDSKKEWRFSIADPFNGKILAVSSEGYKRKKDCMAAFEKVTHAGLIQMVRNDIQSLMVTMDRVQAGHKL